MPECDLYTGPSTPLRQRFIHRKLEPECLRPALLMVRYSRVPQGPSMPLPRRASALGRHGPGRGAD
eukprot:8422604-Pyramimonas_sp.AAC.1